MNFWNRHIGDIIRDTVSLTMLEDGAYTRLLDQYYQTERPLPLDKKMIYRLARATSSAERKAVDFVIQTFFIEAEDGYHQKRCDAEIAAYAEKQRKAQASAKARWNRSEIDANGYANASVDNADEANSELKSSSSNLVRKVGERIPGSPNSDPIESQQSLYLQEIAHANASSSHDSSDMRTHCEGSAHQAPVASNQTPSIKTVGSNTASSEPASVRAKAAELTAAMRRHTVAAQPGDPRIIAAAESGITVETVEAACLEAKQAKQGERISAGYVLSIAERWTAEAAKPRPSARASPQTPRSYHDERADTIAGLTGRNRTQQPDDGVIDVNARAVKQLAG